MAMATDFEVTGIGTKRPSPPEGAPPSGANLALEPATAAQAAERIERAERMETVGRLVGGIAHDFANILTMISGYSDILLGRLGEKDPLRPELDEIRQAANRGARLTAQLLGFTRGQKSERRPIDLNVVVRDLERMLRLITGESVDLDLALSPDLDPVMADASQMEQVIMNLVLNARDAIPAAGRIRVETANREISGNMVSESGMPAGACVTLSISDDGHGIAPDTLDRIFEPFFTTKESGRGTGLGLSTVQRIVNEAGGQICVRSAPGEGSTFTICLPRCARAPERSEHPAHAAQSGSGSETLLLVEDEEGVRRLLTHVLDRRGYKVLAAADGEEALHIFAQRSAEIGLVLTDIVMPHMSGRELGEALEEMRPGVKIIYMSGYTADVLLRTGALSPGMSFLQKPLRPDALAAKVREALDGEAPGRSVAAG